jgi:hypothetical protein
MSGEYISHNCTIANDRTISVKLFIHINEHLNSSEQNLQRECVCVCVCVCGNALSCSKDTSFRLQPILWNNGIKLSSESTPSSLEFTFSHYSHYILTLLGLQYTHHQNTKNSTMMGKVEHCLGGLGFFFYFNLQ